MPSKNKPSDPTAGDNEFRDAVGKVEPLKRRDKARHATKSPSPRPRMRERDDAEVLEELGRVVPDADADTGDELAWRRDGVQHSVLKKLRRGRFHVDANVDLHGFTRAEALKLMTQVLADARAQGDRCIRVVHGKGHGSGQRGPVLRSWLSGWLRKRDEIAAFCSCPPNDGGSGASYVLLRR